MHFPDTKCSDWMLIITWYNKFEYKKSQTLKLKKIDLIKTSQKRILC